MLVMDVTLAMTNSCTDEAAQCMWTVVGCALFNLIILYSMSACRLVLLFEHRLVCIGPTAFVLLLVSSTVQGTLGGISVCVPTG